MIHRGEQHQRRDAVASRRRGAALAELHKALKAMGFYPVGHPLRTEGLRLAFDSLCAAVGEEPLQLAIGKGGFTSSDGEAAVADSPMAQAFARELFIRRVRRLAFLPDLSATDLESFLSLLSLDYRSIPAHGGMEALMARRGITTIWANEIDLSAISRKRQEIEGSFAAAGQGLCVGETAFNLPAGPAAVPSPVPPAADLCQAEGSLDAAAATPEELLGLMAREPDDDRYRELARAFVKECGRLQEGGQFERLLPLLELLQQQGNDGGAGLARRGSALLAFDQAVGEGMVTFLVQRLETQGAREGERLLPLLAQLGSRAAAPLVARLRCAEGARQLKSLVAGLVALGDEGGQPVVELLADGRGPVVQAAAEIVGEVGLRGCEAELRQCLGHSDEGVRREALRSLVRIGGPEAEDAIIGCLDSTRDSTLRRLAAVALGAMRSVRAVEPLLAVVSEGDLFLRTLPLKKDAVVALGKIGDRRAISPLVALMGGRSWLPWRRGEELRCLAATVLGQLGDPAVLPLLGVLASKGGRLGSACEAAAGAIAQRHGEASRG